MRTIFKLPIQAKDPKFYEQIWGMKLEKFVAAMMELRESVDPFQLLKAEYAEAEKSIKRKESIYWKEMLGVLSFALNYPAKHLSAEDMQRLQKSLTPLISIVIAYIPQSSSEKLLALHQAGVLNLITVGDDSKVEPHELGGATYKYTDDAGNQQNVHFETYVDCVGQPHLVFEDFPFKSLLSARTICPAKLKFAYTAAGLKAMNEGNLLQQIVMEITISKFLVLLLMTIFRWWMVTVLITTEFTLWQCLTLAVTTPITLVLISVRKPQVL